MKKKKRSKRGPKDKVKKLLNKVRKDASAFLSSEEGKVLKKNIVKTALALGLTAGAIEDAVAQVHSNSAHVDAAHQDHVTQFLHNDLAAGTAGHSSNHVDAAHADVPHSDHTNHSSHGSGGWC